MKKDNFSEVDKIMGSSESKESVGQITGSSDKKFLRSLINHIPDPDFFEIDGVENSRSIICYMENIKDARNNLKKILSSLELTVEDKAGRIPSFCKFLEKIIREYQKILISIERIYIVDLSSDYELLLKLNLLRKCEIPDLLSIDELNRFDSCNMRDEIIEYYKKQLDEYDEIKESNPGKIYHKGKIIDDVIKNSEKMIERLKKENILNKNEQSSREEELSKVMIEESNKKIKELENEILLAENAEKEEQEQILLEQKELEEKTREKEEKEAEEREKFIEDLAEYLNIEENDDLKEFLLDIKKAVLKKSSKFIFKKKYRQELIEIINEIGCYHYRNDEKFNCNKNMNLP